MHAQRVKDVSPAKPSPAFHDDLLYNNPRSLAQNTEDSHGHSRGKNINREVRELNSHTMLQVEPLITPRIQNSSSRERERQTDQGSPESDV